MVSWKTNGGPVVGAVAFASDGTLFAAIGAGQTTGDGKANAIVALDPKTLQVKDWFTQPAAEFVTGPTILRHSDKDIVAAATKDGRVLLLDATSLGGADHATPLYASKTWLGAGATVSADALASWQQSTAGGATTVDSAAGRRPPGERHASDERCDLGWRRDRPEARSTPAARSSLEPGWVSHDLAARGHADHGQRRGVHAGDRRAGHVGGPRHAGRAPRLRRRDGQTALDAAARR